MKLNILIGLAALALPLAAPAQSLLSIDFETEDSYKSVGVYDTWEASPFRTGKLTGNAAVVGNPYKVTDDLLGDINNSDRVLGVQRSRYGSNTFGARIEFNTPIDLTPQTVYAHVKLYRPQPGRVMLIGLGKRVDRPSQPETVVQFNQMSVNAIGTDKWYDCVFPLSAAKGVQIYSFVVVTDCESTHALGADYVAYIDDIEVNNSSLPRVQYEDYPYNYNESSTITHETRSTSAVKLTDSKGVVQQVTTNQASSRKLYFAKLADQLQAMAGEVVTPAFTSTFSTWMHSYIYLDRNRDGRFNMDINADGTPTAESDIMTYSYYNGKNSKGQSAGSSSSLQPSSFTIPADLTPGFYRIRYKIDWDDIDAGGSVVSDNEITRNGGIIVDTRLNIHLAEVTVTRGQNAEGTNGEILDAEGRALDNTKAEFGKPFTIKAKPGDGFYLKQITIRHGYPDKDSLVHSTPQYEDVVVPAIRFNDDLTYTIPAKWMDGDVRITPVFVDYDPEAEAQGYELNFSEDLQITRTDRNLNSFTVTGSQSGEKQFTLTGTNYVFRNLTNMAKGVVAGETINIAVNYTGRAMHTYFYLDRDHNGAFDCNLGDNGVPTSASELLAYSCYNNLNSLGEAIAYPGTVPVNAVPQFTIPADLEPGIYRARFKIDWNNIDPAGQWSENGSNKINENAGYVVDFMMNVYDGAGKLEVLTTNGSIVGAGVAGLSKIIPYGQALTVRPVPAAEGYEADRLVVRHGHGIDGKQFYNGNRQWSEYTVDLSSVTSLTIPADSIDGDVRISADFQPSNSEYELVWSDEFNGADGTQPDAEKWRRDSRANPTWKRFIAQTEAGQAATGYIEDGKFVARCIATPGAMAEAEGNVAMISGAINSSNLFSCTYGKIEGRLLTQPHVGNFPAFWMMPQDNSKGWPYAGEIDIWEQIDAQSISYHTIHTGWANGAGDGGMGNSNNPAKSGSKQGVTPGNYHTFGLEWSEDLLSWFVDGEKVFSYAKLKDNDYALSNGQWPFDAPFYIILNQSVGNGGWAANPDTGFTYETLFDWVRVYQKEGQTHQTGVTSLAGRQRLDFYAAPGRLTVVAPDATQVSLYDTAGRLVLHTRIQGNKTLSLPSGVYVLNGRKVLVP